MEDAHSKKERMAVKRGARAGRLWTVAEPGTPFGPTAAPGQATPAAARAAAGPIVRNGIVYRETACRTVLNRSSISDYSLNCYTGCAHGCVYCYARFMQRFHPHPEPWGAFVDVKVNAVEALQRQLRRAKPGNVFMSSACDGWQPIEKERRLTRGCCERLLEAGFQVNVLTKSELVLRDFDLFVARAGSSRRAGGRVRIGVTVATADERLRSLWEAGASSVAARFRVIAEAKRAGLATGIMFAPLLPALSDTRESLTAMFERAADVAAEELWVDALNPRPKVWPSVAGLLRSKFPGLCDRYRRILFDQAEREAYLAQLRDRVTEAAGRFGLRDRLTICF